MTETGHDHVFQAVVVAKYSGGGILTMALHRQYSQCERAFLVHFFFFFGFLFSIFAVVV